MGRYSPDEVSSKGKAYTKLSVGTFKEQYEMQAELGSGAHSVVRLALHKGTKALRAVKITQTKGLSPEDISAIDQEIGSAPNYYRNDPQHIPLKPNPQTFTSTSNLQIY